MSKKRKRYSVYSTPPIRTVAEKLGNDQGLTSRLSEIIERYQLLCESPPAISDTDRAKLRTILSRLPLSPSDITALPSIIRDSDPELALQVEPLPLLQRIALLESL